MNVHSVTDDHDIGYGVDLDRLPGVAQLLLAQQIVSNLIQKQRNPPEGSHRSVIRGMPHEEAIEHLCLLLDEILTGTVSLEQGFSATESRILSLLRRRSPGVVSYEALTALCDPYILQEDSVNCTRSHIKRMRKKLRDCEIKTVYGVGYALFPVKAA